MNVLSILLLLAPPPDLCGTESSALVRSDDGPPQRGWESVPGVIRADGVDAFYLEVFVTEAVAGVRLGSLAIGVRGPSPGPIELRDDGSGGDRVAGDRIYTAGPFTSDPAVEIPSHFADDASSPEGLFIHDVGHVVIDEIGGTTSEFLIDPRVALLRPDIPPSPVLALSPALQAAPHVANVREEGVTRFSLLHGDVARPARPFYDHFADQCSVLVYVTTSRVEVVPRTDPGNFASGLASPVKVDFDGTGHTSRDFTAEYGSRGALRSAILLAAYDRGLKGNNAVHEILHLWSAHTDPSLGLQDAVHYPMRSSVGSLLGGFRWVGNGDGTFTRDCSEGRNGARSAAPLDLYMMGLIEAAEVGPLYVQEAESGEVCGDAIAQDGLRTVTVDEIVARHGPRLPGPADAQRQWALCFVAVSHERLLSETEMTFYDILARHFTAQVPDGEPDPYLGENWPSMTRYFGHGTTWTSQLYRDDGDFCRIDGSPYARGKVNPQDDCLRCDPETDPQGWTREPDCTSPDAGGAGGTDGGEPGGCGCRAGAGPRGPRGAAWLLAWLLLACLAGRTPGGAAQ